MATVRQLLAAADALPADSARRDAEILLCHCLDKPRAWLYTWPEAEVEPAVERAFRSRLSRRGEGVPIAYLTGQREFWSLQLVVNEHTLIPRAETETLVEWALELPLPPATVALDLGTGSGAIALAVARERVDWKVTAVDASAAALRVATGNASANGLQGISFLHSDWFSALGGRRFNLVMSNPPYVDSRDEHLLQGDLRFEPRRALVAEERGLADLRKLSSAAPDHLCPRGWLLLEHGFEQGEAVRELLAQRGFMQVSTRRDAAGLERVTGGCWHAQ